MLQVRLANSDYAVIEHYDGKPIARLLRDPDSSEEHMTKEEVDGQLDVLGWCRCEAWQTTSYGLGSATIQLKERDA